MVWKTFVTCLQGYIKEFGYVSDYSWKWQKAHFEKIHANF